ncbi:MAG: DUF362 domain-containing protein [Planctomycetes bacterium]|nr:DUF362 domain-containing protein [Planctomycetota bacterium]
MDSRSHGARRSTRRHELLLGPRRPPWRATGTIAPSSVAVALLALAWLLLRSGFKPSRLAYPCQRWAFDAAAGAFGPALLAAALAAPALAVAGASVALVALALALFPAQEPRGGGAVAPPEGYRPEVFVVDRARGPEPSRHGGVDDLVLLLGANGLKWHRSAGETATSAPGGLIDRDDLVLVKINAQWPERGGTSTDVLRGVIRRVVEHPDGFAGEVLVADNGQGLGSLDRSQSNAEDHSQSVEDVVGAFAAEGWRVSAMLWDGMRGKKVGELSAGDMEPGYVVSDSADPETGVRVSYPKLRTPLGTFVSYKHGVWSPDTRTYDPGNLVVINLPVLKTHSVYGITACVKNHMGVVTADLSTGSHNAVGRGGMGSILAEVRMPDINILDCTWVLARPGSGPSATYAAATRRDLLAASADPVALDAWAAKNVLVPLILENGYRPEDYRSMQDPDNPDSVFRRYLDRSMAELLRAGIETTNDPAAVALRVWPDDGPPASFIRGDANGDGDLDISDPIGVLRALFLGTGTIPCEDAADANDDGRIDLADAVFSLGHLFLGGPAPPAPFPAAGSDPTADELGCRAR